MKYKCFGGSYLERRFKLQCGCSAGVYHSIPYEIRSTIWEIVYDNKTKGAILDNLQSFHLLPQGQNLKIIHSQQTPKYSKEFTMPLECEFVETILWIVGNEDYLTMIFPEECHALQACKDNELKRCSESLLSFRVYDFALQEKLDRHYAKLNSQWDELINVTLAKFIDDVEIILRGRH